MSLDIGLYVEVDTGGDELRSIELYHANYTANVYPMWIEAGVDEALYKSNEMEAATIIPILEDGIRNMESNPHTYIAMNPPNGWGDSVGALRFLRRLLAACKDDPLALINSW